MVGTPWALRSCRSAAEYLSRIISSGLGCGLKWRTVQRGALGAPAWTFVLDEGNFEGGFVGLLFSGSRNGIHFPGKTRTIGVPQTRHWLIHS